MANKVNIVYFLIICLLLFSPTNSFSQNRNIRFECLSAEEGLSLSTIQCIYQDSKGFIWLGTEGGLYRYDGYNFKIFNHNPDDPKSLSFNDIYAIYEDSPGIIWIGTYGGGLNKFNMKTETFTHYRHRPDDPTSLSDDEVLSVIKDQFGNLWIGTYGGGLNKLAKSNEKDSLLTFIHYRPNINDHTSLDGDEIYSIC